MDLLSRFVKLVGAPQESFFPHHQCETKFYEHSMPFMLKCLLDLRCGCTRVGKVICVVMMIGLRAGVGNAHKIVNNIFSNAYLMKRKRVVYSLLEQSRSTLPN